MIEFDSVNMETEREKVKRQRLAELDKIMEGGIEPKKSEKQPAIPRVLLLSRNPLNLNPLSPSRLALPAFLT